MFKQLLLPAVLLAGFLLSATATRGEELRFKRRLMAELVEQVPEILRTYDPATGHFGSGIWLCTDQHEMWPLAVAYATPAKGNSYYHDAKLLEVIIKAGDALIADMNPKGQWVFRKKDGSTWGYKYMCWTYSQWIRTFGLIREQMPLTAREQWSHALVRGYTAIASGIHEVHNIPTEHAMGLYAAGQILQRPEWCRKATDFMAKVLAAQHEGGYWTEGGGPVVAYNFAYVSALGAYYAMSHDQRVLPALAKAADFHRHLTYPDGSSVETIDQRSPFGDGISPGNVGFTMSLAGRAYLLTQWNRCQWQLGADLIASLIHDGEEGPIADPSAADNEPVWVLKDRGLAQAATIRRGPWFVCLSAYTTPIAANRWHQDRQNLVSIFHDRVGLILGGGNTKLQPAWSDFTVGDPSALTHKQGDEDPDFLPPDGKLFHVPLAAKLLLEPSPSLELTYGPETCRIVVVIKDEQRLEYRLEATNNSGLSVAAHLTLMPHLHRPLETANGQKVILGDDPLVLSPSKLGSWLTHAGWRLRVPDGTDLHWPSLPHNPYRKDGHADPIEGRIVVRTLFDRQHSQRQFSIEVPK